MFRNAISLRSLDINAVSNPFPHAASSRRLLLSSASTMKLNAVSVRLVLPFNALIGFGLPKTISVSAGLPFPACPTACSNGPTLSTIMPWLKDAMVIAVMRANPWIRRLRGIALKMLKIKPFEDASLITWILSMNHTLFSAYSIGSRFSAQPQAS